MCCLFLISYVSIPRLRVVPSGSFNGTEDSNCVSALVPGIMNLKALQDVMSTQSLPYVFPFSQFSFPTDLGFVVLAEGRKSAFFQVRQIPLIFCYTIEHLLISAVVRTLTDEHHPPPPKFQRRSNRKRARPVQATRANKLAPCREIGTISGSGECCQGGQGAGWGGRFGGKYTDPGASVGKRPNVHSISKMTLYEKGRMIRLSVLTTSL